MNFESEQTLQFARLFLAVIRGETQTVRNLLEYVSEEMLNLRDPVCSATINAFSTSSGLFCSLESILQHNYTALIWASFGGHTEIVKLLLDTNCIEINAQDQLVIFSPCVYFIRTTFIFAF